MKKKNQLENPIRFGISQWIDGFQKKYPKRNVEKIEAHELTLEDKAYLLLGTIFIVTK